jgi:hypothetical protein
MSRAIVCAVLLAACTKKTEPAPAAEPPTPAPVAAEKLPPPPPPPPPVAEVDAGAQELVVVDTPPPPAPAEEAPAEPPRPGGFDEADWRRRFRAAHARIDSVDARIAEAKRLIAASEYESGMGSVRGHLPTVRPGYEDAKRLIEDEDRERKAAEDELSDLERDAANAGVPLEWRR